MNEWAANDDAAGQAIAGPPWTRLFGRGPLPADGPANNDSAPARNGDEARPALAAPIAIPPRLAPSLTAPRFPRRIETPRLALDMPTLEDFHALQRMAADASMFRYSERGAMTADEAWNLLLRHVGHWLVAGYGVFTVRDKASGRFAGLVGGSSFQRNLGPDFDAVPEMTWTIASEFRGRGFATEAAAAVVEAVEAQPALQSTVCLIHVDNQASLRVAAKLGFRFFRYCDYRGYGAGLFCR
ncbi:GNAT family N-acetyltransferase [Sphingosinicella sp. LHD-64]|uniref:GNAT family N-acetyltransferase n=1 Tax=Sphingosinicella sp. LHD-64 TaxID=3072139 RepID=UPI00280F09CC|nr:GNAT family N-acetyltransferase [Sphingosinicella sp. LHD-64]MDQ8755488.1 GNAT family N-acetyltransferase [Sphingosinicella sp. LHD-64]